MSETRDYSPDQLRKILHLKVFLILIGALAFLGVVQLLLPIGPYVLALIVFAFLATAFFSGTSKFLDRFVAKQLLVRECSGD